MSRWEVVEELEWVMRLKAILTRNMPYLLWLRELTIETRCADTLSFEAGDALIVRYDNALEWIKTKQYEGAPLKYFANAATREELLWSLDQDLGKIKSRISRLEHLVGEMTP